MNDQIIIATAHLDLIQNAYHKKIMMVDFVSKFDDLEENLRSCFRDIYQTFNNNKVLSFKKEGEIINSEEEILDYIEAL